MIIGLVAKGAAILVGDRLVSKVRQKDGHYIDDYDDTANKQIILVGSNGWALIGYSGPAYVEGIPTDFWLAEAILSDALPRHPFALSNVLRPPVKLATALWRIGQRIAATPKAHGIEVLAVGYRNYGQNSSLPFLWRWARCRTTHWFYRHRDNPNRLRISYVGAHVPQEALENRFGPYVTPTSINLTVERCVELLSDVVEETSATSPSVGRDLIRIWGQPLFGLRYQFTTAELHRAAIKEHLRGFDGAIHFSPFLIGPNFVSPPQATNMGAATAVLNGVVIQEVLDPSGPKPTGGLGITGASRRPPLRP